MKKFDVAINRKTNQLFVILSDMIDVPYFDDGCASFHAFDPMDITDPKEWEKTIPAYIGMNLKTQTHELIFKPDVRLFENCDEVGHSLGYIPFDEATSQLRMVLGLLNYAKKCYGKEGCVDFQITVK